MTRSLWLGAVAYDPKVVTIWEGMRTFFRVEAKLDLEIVLFLSYEAQVAALLGDGPAIDIAWNTNLAFLQCEAWSAGSCLPLGMRDTDLGWQTHIIALRGGPVKSVADVRGKTVALGSRDSGHAAILPVHFLASEGLVADRDYRTLRFDVDVGKHGDTGTSESDVLKAVLDGRADAGAVGSPFWAGLADHSCFPPIPSTWFGRRHPTPTACSPREPASTKHWRARSKLRYARCNGTTRDTGQSSKRKA